MTRYIDADALYKKLYPLDLADKRKYTINAKAVADAIAKTPTADVVPKSEVENVIDEFIQKVCEKYEIWTDSDEREYRYTLNLMEEAKAELKKKYTEEKK